MSNIAIRVEHLSKQYHINCANKRHDRLGEKLADSLRSFWRRNGRSEASQSSFWAFKDISFEIKHGEVSSEVTEPARVHCSRSSPASRSRRRARQRSMAE
jgi:ABC-type uncharacterized transport system ATPase subunit